MVIPTLFDIFLNRQFQLVIINQSDILIIHS